MLRIALLFAVFTVHQAQDVFNFVQHNENLTDAEIAYFNNTVEYKRYDVLPVKAVCRLTSPLDPSGIKGVIELYQQDILGGVLIIGNFTGMATSSAHEFHFHVSGDTTGPRGCQQLGGIFDPLGVRYNVSSDGVPRVYSDFDRINSDASGQASIVFVDPRVQLIGPYSVIGRACSVHDAFADPSKGACGTIGYA